MGVVCSSHGTDLSARPAAHLANLPQVHPGGLLTLALMSAHNRDNFEVFCFATNEKKDKYTDLFRRRCEHFVDLAGLPVKEGGVGEAADKLDNSFALIFIPTRPIDFLE